MRCTRRRRRRSASLSSAWRSKMACGESSLGLDDQGPLAVTVDEVCAVAAALPRAYEVVVRGRLKFRVGRIVFLSFSNDGTVMGFGFPKEWRAALVEEDP